MTTYYLINSVQIAGGSLLWPGTIVDSLVDPIAKLQSAGAILEPTSNQFAAASEFFPDYTDASIYNDGTHLLNAGYLRLANALLPSIKRVAALL
jgi:lysophospholipase L1-like esterase